MMKFFELFPIALLALFAAYLAYRSDEFGEMWARSDKRLYGESYPDRFYQRSMKIVGYVACALFSLFYIIAVFR